VQRDIFWRFLLFGWIAQFGRGGVLFYRILRQLLLELALVDGGSFIIYSEGGDCFDCEGL